jgi:hypothetical protein
MDGMKEKKETEAALLRISLRFRLKNEMDLRCGRHKGVASFSVASSM